MTSVHFSHSVVSKSLQPHELQHTRLLCPPTTPGACSNSCPSNHLILCCPLLLPAIFPSIRVFLVSQLFTSGGQTIGASSSASVLPMNITGFISLQSKTLSRVFSNTTVPGSGRSPGEGNGNLLQYSCLGNPLDREAWWGAVHSVAKSQT